MTRTTFGWVLVLVVLVKYDRHNCTQMTSFTIGRSEGSSRLVYGPTDNADDKDELTNYL